MSEMDYAKDASHFELIKRIRNIRDIWKKSNYVREFFLGSDSLESLVGGIIRACCINSISDNEAFSYIDQSIHEQEGNFNYNYLIENLYVRKEVRRSKDVVFPTEKLVKELEIFLGIN